MHLGCIYLHVKDYDKSVRFYENLLEMKVSAENKDRFAMFHFEGHCIALMNSFFDREHPDLVVHKGESYDYFDNSVEIANEPNSRKAVLNFWVEDLKKEYQRIMKMNPPKITKIRYLCYKSPYYYFHLTDLDGNIIEITGDYKPEENANVSIKM